MIATILPASSTFHAVAYNEKKREKGAAYVIAAENIPGLKFGMTSDELRDFFVSYSRDLNPNVKKPQFHVAFSVKGNEMTHSEIFEIAKLWLKEMGYADEKQPMIAYAHTDTENNHIHIITSRVNPYGKKIDHNKERVRGRQVLNRIMKDHLNRNVNNDIAEALSYSLSSTFQFRAVMQSMGYEAYEKNGTIYLKRNGMIQTKIPASKIHDQLKPGEKDIDRLKQLRAIFNKYQVLSSSRDDFAKTIKDQFGISIIFMGKKSNPYGFVAIDHRNKRVWHGASIISINRLKHFPSIEERFSRSDELIKQLIEDNPYLTTVKLNRILKRQFGFGIYKGKININGIERIIPDDLKEILCENDRIAWWTKFSPSDQNMRRIICEMAKIEDVDRIPLSPKDTASKKKLANNIRQVMESTTGNIWDDIHNVGYRILWRDNQCYCIDYASHTIINVAEAGIDTLRLVRPVSSHVGYKVYQASDIHKPSQLKSALESNDHGQKRDWEIDDSINPDDPDYQSKFKR